MGEEEKQASVGKEGEGGGRGGRTGEEEGTTMSHSCNDSLQEDPGCRKNVEAESAIDVVNDTGVQNVPDQGSCARKHTGNIKIGKPNDLEGFSPLHGKSPKAEADTPERSIVDQRKVKELLSSEHKNKLFNRSKWKLVCLENGMRIFQRNAHSTNTIASLLTSKTVVSRLFRGLKNIFDEFLFLSPPPPSMLTRASIGIEVVNPLQPLSLSPLPCYKSFITINGDAETVFQVLLDYGHLRNEWDINYEKCESLNDLDFDMSKKELTKASDFLHLTLKKPSVYNAASRDFALYREWWRDSSDREKGESYVIVHRSTRSLCIPETLPGVVRAYMAGWAYVVMPLHNSSKTGSSIGKCVVMQLLELNPGGWIHLIPNDTRRYAFDIMESVCGVRDLFEHVNLSEIKDGLSQEAIKKASVVCSQKEMNKASNKEPDKSITRNNIEEAQFDSDTAFHNSSFEHPYEESDEYWSDNDCCYYDSDVGDLYSRTVHLGHDPASVISAENMKGDKNIKKRPYRSRVRSAFWKAAKKGASMSYKAAKSGLGSKSASRAIYRRYQSRRSRKHSRDMNFEDNKQALNLGNETKNRNNEISNLKTETIEKPTNNTRVERQRSKRRSYSDSEEFQSDVDYDIHEDWTSISISKNDRSSTNNNVYTFVPQKDNDTDLNLKEPSANEILSSSSTARQYLQVVENLDTTDNLVVTVVEEHDRNELHENLPKAAATASIIIPSSSERFVQESSTESPSTQGISTVTDPIQDNESIEETLEKSSDSQEDCSNRVAPHPSSDLCPLLLSQGGGSVAYGYNMVIESLSAERLSARNRFMEASSIDCWAEPAASLFRVRGSSYLTDKIKVPATKSKMHLAAVDWFKSDEIIDGIGSNKNGIVQQTLLKDNDNVFCFIVNMQVPLGAQHRSLVLYYVSTVGNICADKESLLSKFVNGDDAFQADRFKLIPNIAFGPLIVKKSVGNKPLIVRNALATNFVRGDRFFEVDINIGSSSVAYYVVKLVLGYVRKIVVDLVFLIQGNTEAELKDCEAVIGTIRISRLEPDACVEYPKSKKETK